MNLRGNGAVAHQGGQIGRTCRLRIVVRAVVLNVGIRTALDRGQSRNAHGRRAKDYTGRDEARCREVPANRILPGHFRRVVGYSSPGIPVCNGVTAGEN